MCFQVYLGASQECLEIPYHVGVISCGCGFSYDIPAHNWDDNGWTLNNHRQLGEYVPACLERSEPIELLICWSGDEFLPIQKYRDITLAELLEPQFYFEERQLTVVYKNQKSLRDAKRQRDNNK